jgi:uncharacterized membrane protein (DUF2068 family)
MDPQTKTTAMESRASAKPPPVKEHAPTLYFIAIGKMIKGVSLLLVAVGIYSLAGRDLPDIFDKFVEWIRLDPEHSFFHNISEFLANITPGNVRATALATFLYGMYLFATGFGLAIRAKWAIWLTIGESAFFIPIEIFKLVERHPQIESGDEPITPHHHMFPYPKMGLAAVLALNILIAWYLLKNRQRLFRHHD